MYLFDGWHSGAPWLALSSLQRRRPFFGSPLQTTAHPRRIYKWLRRSVVDYSSKYSLQEGVGKLAQCFSICHIVCILLQVLSFQSKRSGRRNRSTKVGASRKIEFSKQVELCQETTSMVRILVMVLLTLNCWRRQFWTIITVTYMTISARGSTGCASSSREFGTAKQRKRPMGAVDETTSGQSDRYAQNQHRLPPKKLFGKQVGAVYLWGSTKFSKI